jgi:hypothetical protein
MRTKLTDNSLTQLVKYLSGGIKFVGHEETINFKGQIRN